MIKGKLLERTHWDSDVKYKIFIDLIFFSNKSQIFVVFIYLFYVCEYTVTVFRHTRRGHQISLLMVVSHHVVAGI